MKLETIYYSGGSSNLPRQSLISVYYFTGVSDLHTYLDLFCCL